MIDVPRRGNLLKLVGKIRAVFEILRLRAYDTSSPEGRALERHRRMALSVIASGISKAVSMGTIFLTMPLANLYLGTDRYELWMTMVSTIGMLYFADLGMGSGLLNLTSTASGKNDIQAAAKAVSSAFFMLFTVGLVLGMVLFSSLHWFPWDHLLKVHSPKMVGEMEVSLRILFLCFALNLPLGVVSRVQIGYQDGFINGMWLMAGNILGLAGLLISIILDAGLPWLVFSAAGAPVLSLLINGVVLFFRQRPQLLPRWSSFSLETAKQLLGMGMMFFVLQVTYAITYASDNLIAKNCLSPGAVTEYTAVATLFGIIPKVVEMLCTPLWPAYGEAIARGDFRWVRQTLVRSFILAVCLSAAVGGAMVLFGDAIIRYWFNKAVVPSHLLLIGFGVWTVLQVAGNVVAMFLNGINVIGFQSVCAVALAFVALGLKLGLTPHWGLPVIVWATVFAYIICAAVPIALYLPKLLRRLKSDSLRHGAEDASLCVKSARQNSNP